MAEISPEDAQKLGVADNDWVKLSSRRGSVEARVKVTPASPAGVVYMNFHFAKNCSNFLTNNALDPVAKTPEYKVCAVKLEIIAPKAVKEKVERAV